MTATPDTEVGAEEGRLQRRLGVAGAHRDRLYAAQIAGPAAILAWIAAGLLCALVALVMVELGATRPEGGGTVRWPLYASGRLTGTVFGVSVLLAVPVAVFVVPRGAVVRSRADASRSEAFSWT